MALTIHYRLSLAAASYSHVQRLLKALRKEAVQLGFSRVGHLQKLGEPALVRDPDQPGVTHAIDPIVALGFRTWPSEGEAEASFGLSRYPAAVLRKDGASFPTGLPLWCSRGFCSTGTADDEQHGGVVNFVRCHIGVVALLEAAARMGFRVEVLDDAAYWETRDVLALARNARKHIELMAVFAATMYELSQDHGDLIEAIGVQDSSLSKVFKLIWLTRSRGPGRSSEAESYL